MKILTSVSAAMIMAMVFASCIGSSTSDKTRPSGPYNPATGIGKFTTMVLDSVLNKEMVEKGRLIYNQKCAACHKLDNTKIVGPGWKGLTRKHSPAWIMNYLTNTDEMIDTDPELKQLIAGGSPRMPDQNLTDDEARSILEFMRQNDAQ
ncbi:MAG TPA: cytochrome c [Edaphocola sp.]|nr:cytochrome c [Edaphocola sp.]